MNEIKTDDKSITNHVPINKGFGIYQNRQTYNCQMNILPELDSNTSNANKILHFIGDNKHKQTIN